MVGFLDVVTFLAWVLARLQRGSAGEEAERCGVRSEVGSRVPRSGREWSERRRGRRRPDEEEAAAAEDKDGRGKLEE